MEFTLSTWDSNSQFRLQRVIEKCSSGEMKKRISLSTPWHSPYTVRFTPAKDVFYLVKLIQSILGKCTQAIHKLMFVIALPESQLFSISEVSPRTGNNAGNYCNHTLAKENHLELCYVVHIITTKKWLKQ